MIDRGGWWWCIAPSDEAAQEIARLDDRARVYRDRLLRLPPTQAVAEALWRHKLSAPIPIVNYYDWPGGLKPMRHQKITAAFLTRVRRGLVLNEIGTGKTMSALWAADWLMQQGVVRRALVIAPLSTLHSVWASEVFLRLPHRSAVVLHGARQRRLSLMDKGADFFIINHDGVHIVLNHERMDEIDLVIVDEAAVLRNPSTRRFRAVFRLASNPETRLWLMTGTPTPNGPEDAWALSRLVGGGAPPSYTRWRNEVLYRVGPFTWRPRADAMEKVAKVLKPAVRFKRADCLDLPPTVYQVRRVELSAEQAKAMRQMRQKLLVELETEGKQITAANEAVKAMKLAQIAGGVVYDDAGNWHFLAAKARENALLEVMDEVGGPCLIFVPFRAIAHRLTELLKSKGKRVAMVVGGSPLRERREAFTAMQAGQLDALVAHPGCMSHGLTLTRAEAIIWYGPTASHETYEQANGRVERPGKTKTTAVVHIVSDKIEELIFARLRSKKQLQGVLLEALSMK